MNLQKPNAELTFASPSTGFSVFLAGTIDNGLSKDWQTEVCDQLSQFNITVYNPRRRKWDSDLEQTAKNEVFSYQVNWEMNCIENADVVFFYFIGDSLSPISIGEYYWCLANNKSIITVCEPGFWRRGNIEVMLERQRKGLIYDTLDEGVKVLTTLAEFHSNYPVYK